MANAATARSRVVDGVVYNRHNPDLDWLFDGCSPEPNSGCWIWEGRRTRSGYGEIDTKRTRSLTHRLAYSFTKGGIPDGMRVCHRCDVTLCLNPDHLFLGTDADNARDRSQKNRSVRWNGARRGAGNPCSKLDDLKVVEIRRLRLAGLTQREIAERFGVATGTIGSICSGRKWGHVPSTSEGSSHV